MPNKSRIHTIGGLVDEQCPDLVGEADPAGRAGGELLGIDEAFGDQRCSVGAGSFSSAAASAMVNGWSAFPSAGPLGWQSMFQCRRPCTRPAVKGSPVEVERFGRLRMPAICASG